MRSLAVVLAASSVAPAALAQPLPEPEPAPLPPVVQSVLPQLFATSPGVTAELHVAYSDFDEIDLTVVNVLAHVQYVAPEGFGGYVRVPFGYVEADDDLFGGSGLGNIEVGGLYVTRVERTDLLARVGLAVDTSAEEDALGLTLSTILPRLVDTYATSLETTWARGQVQLRHAVDNVRIGGAVGFDVPVAGDGVDAELTGVLNAVVSAGLQQGLLGVAVGFSLLRPIAESDDELVKGLNLGIDYAIAEGTRLGAQLGLSLEDNTDGVAFGVGTRATF